MSSAICFQLDQSKIVSSGTGLKGFLLKGVKRCQHVTHKLRSYCSPARIDPPICAKAISNLPL